MQSLDPSDINPASVERELLRLARRLEDATQQTGVWARKAATAEVAYKIGYAKALLASSGTVAEREATALVACEEQYREREMARAVLDAGKTAGQNIRAQLDALRSVGANLRDLVMKSAAG